MHYSMIVVFQNIFRTINVIFQELFFGVKNFQCIFHCLSLAHHFQMSFNVSCVTEYDKDFSYPLTMELTRLLRCYNSVYDSESYCSH